MKPLFSLVILALALSSPLVAAQSPAIPHAVTSAADAGVLPRQEMTPQILYQFLLAEIAAQKGQFGIAAGAYLDLARSTRDPRVVRRAAEVAFHARQHDNALEAVRIWLEIDPASQQARQLRATALLAGGRVAELAALLAIDVAAAGERAGDALLQLSRAFARYPDRVAIDRLFDILVKPYPLSPEAQFARAQAAMGVGNAELAGAAIDRALQLRPDWEPAALLKAEFLPKGEARIDFLKSWLAANSAGQQARLAHARALVGEKRYEEARGEFRILLDNNPDNPEILYAVGILSLQVNAVADAEQPLRRFVELGRGDLNSPRFYLGQIAEQAERYEDAIRWYDQVEAGENLLTARIRAARALWKLDRLDQARERLAAAQAGNPGEMRLVIAEGQMLRDAGRHEEAFSFLAKALEVQPEHPDLLYEVALAAEKLRQLELAERHLRRLIALKPDSPQGYNALGYTLADHNIRLDEAAELVDKALSLAPDDSFILDSKGWVLYRQGKLAAALETLRKAYARQPDAEIAARVGEVLWKLGRPDEARAIWSEAGKAFPKNEALNETIKRFLP